MHGHLDVVKLLVAHGSQFDRRDENGETPMYYAIKGDKGHVLDYLISLGCNLNNTNFKNVSLVNIASRLNKTHLKNKLIEAGAFWKRKKDIDEERKKKEKEEEKKQKEKLEKEKLKEFSLEILDGDRYRAITMEEFQQFCKKSPELAKYFLEPETELPKLDVPATDQSARIYHHWEKACSRMLTILLQNPDCWIFKDPVDTVTTGAADYYTVIKQPMDFSTMRDKLKKHQYRKIEEFIQDMRLVFNNCIFYNGNESKIAEMCRNVQSHYHD